MRIISRQGIVTGIAASLVLSFSGCVFLVKTAEHLVNKINTPVYSDRVEIPKAAAPVQTKTPEIQPLTESKVLPAAWGALSPCEQMDTVAREGRSVREYVKATGKASIYAHDASILCSWNLEQAQLALPKPVQTIAKAKRKHLMTNSNQQQPQTANSDSDFCLPADCDPNWTPDGAEKTSQYPSDWKRQKQAEQGYAVGLNPADDVQPDRYVNLLPDADTLRSWNEAEQNKNR